MKRFAGKTVLVTGGSVGIGRATALAFANEGANVVVSSRRENEGIAAVKAIQSAGGSGIYVRGDVSKEQDVVAMIERTVKTYGQLDVVFNNAGIEGKLGPIDTLTVADYEDTMGVNVRGTWLVMKHALPLLTKTKGTIINNGTVAAEIGFPNTTIYAASKGAVHALTRTAAIEFIKAGVRVNAVAPGPIETDMGQRFFGSLDNMHTFAKSTVPVGFAGAPKDIADAVLFLASSEARFIVGQTLLIDGGLSTQ